MILHAGQEGLGAPHNRLIAVSCTIASGEDEELLRSKFRLHTVLGYLAEISTRSVGERVKSKTEVSVCSGMGSLVRRPLALLSFVSTRHFNRGQCVSFGNQALHRYLCRNTMR